ncbi:MAG: ROK family protein [Candidatus Cryosericum sp.]
MKQSTDVANVTAGVDIGGTKMTFILWSGGSVFYKTILPYTARSNGKFEELMQKGMTDLMQHAAGAGTAIAATGIGCAGMADQKLGILRFSPNMPGVHDVPLVEVVAGLTGAPAFLENDANCALFAEWVSGVAVGHRNVAMLSVGTGVGGALILDGHLYVGRHGYAGEMGHIPMVERGLVCGCGRHGCLETIASGTGIERYTKRALTRGSASQMTMEDAASARTIAVFAHNGDRLARQAFSQSARALGRAAGGIINLLDPDMIVLGGGVSESGLLMDEMKHVAQRRSLPLLFDGVEFAEAYYRNDAGAIGAALLAQELLAGHAVYAL